MLTSSSKNNGLVSTSTTARTSDWPVSTRGSALPLGETVTEMEGNVPPPPPPPPVPPPALV